MLDSEVCRDLAARCGGGNIGVCGGDVAGLLSGGAAGLNFTDGSSPCAAYIFFGEAQGDFAELSCGRPFIVVGGNGAELSARYGCACLDRNADAEEVLRALCAEFPVCSVGVDIPGWMCFLPRENSAIAELLARLREISQKICKMRDISALDALTSGAAYWAENISVSADFSCGEVTVTVPAKEGIFFDMLSEIAGDEIDGEYSLMRYVRSAAEAKSGYAKVRDALECARVNGYGIVKPSGEETEYEKPQTVRQGQSVGLRLRASAPSYHIIRVDVSGEVSPIMGDASQSEGIVKSMMDGFETDPEATWNTDVFGRTLRSMVQEGLASKVNSIAEDTRGKLRRAITRMVNEGKGGVICIIL